MAKITVPAFCLDDNFVKEIKEDLGITVTNTGNAPYEVIFEGSVEGLAIMLHDHWQMPLAEIIQTIIKD